MWLPELAWRYHRIERETKSKYYSGCAASCSGTAGISVSPNTPQLPAPYWGTVTVYEQAQEIGAHTGTIITAWVDGKKRGSITVTEPGKYEAVGLAPNLSVQGDNLAGSEVEFYINSVRAVQIANFQNGRP